MTNKEAICLLNSAPIMGVERNKSKLPLAEAVEIAIKSLEKQIKKPTGGTFAGYCPDCKNIVFGDQKFCSRCGKALDWGIEK